MGKGVIYLHSFLLIVMATLVQASNAITPLKLLIADKTIAKVAVKVSEKKLYIRTPFAHAKLLCHCGVKGLHPVPLLFLTHELDLLLLSCPCNSLVTCLEQHLPLTWWKAWVRVACSSWRCIEFYICALLRLRRLPAPRSIPIWCWSYVAAIALLSTVIYALTTA